MTCIRLTEEDQNKLVIEPETGMGFQVIWATVGSKSPKRYVAFGSTILLPAENIDEFLDSLKKIASSGIRKFDELEAEPGSFRGKVETMESRLDINVGTQFTQTRLFDPQSVVLKNEKASPMAYFRFSANPNDPRVLSNGNFTAGTYATTYNDLRMVPSGFAAVGRYALPNPLSARFVYILVTDSTPQLIGTAVPKFGQAGGGVEVLFLKEAKALYAIPHEIEAA